MPKLPYMRNGDQQFQSFDDDSSEGSNDGLALLSNHGGGEDKAEEKRSASPLRRMKQFAANRMNNNRKKEGQPDEVDADTASKTSESQSGVRPPSPVESQYSESNISASTHSVATEQGGNKETKKKVKKRNLLAPLRTRSSEDIPTVPEGEIKMPEQSAHGSGSPRRRRPSLLASMMGGGGGGANVDPSPNTKSPSDEGTSMRSNRSNDTERGADDRALNAMYEYAGQSQMAPNASANEKKDATNEPSSPETKPKKSRQRITRRASFKGLIGGRKEKKDGAAPESASSSPRRTRMPRRASFNATTQAAATLTTEAAAPAGKARFARRSSLSSAAQSLEADTPQDEEVVAPVPEPEPSQKPKRFARRASLDNGALLNSKDRENAPTKSVMKRRTKSPQKRVPNPAGNDASGAAKPQKASSRRKAPRRHSLSAGGVATAAEPETTKETDRLSESGKERDEDTKSETSRSARSDKSTSRRRVQRTQSAQDEMKREKRDLLRKHKSLKGLTGTLGKLPGRPVNVGDSQSVSGNLRSVPRTKSAQESDTHSVSGDLRRMGSSASSRRQDSSTDLGQICENNATDSTYSPKTPTRSGEKGEMSAEDRVLELLNKVGSDSNLQKSPSGKPKLHKSRSVTEKSPSTGSFHKKKVSVDDSSNTSTPQSKTKGFVKQLKSEQSRSRTQKGENGSPTSVADFEAPTSPSRRKKRSTVPAAHVEQSPGDPTNQQNTNQMEAVEGGEDQQGFAQLSFATGQDGNGILDVQYESQD